MWERMGQTHRAGLCARGGWSPLPSRVSPQRTSLTRSVAVHAEAVPSCGADGLHGLRVALAAQPSLQRTPQCPLHCRPATPPHPAPLLESPTRLREAGQRGGSDNGVWSGQLCATGAGDSGPKWEEGAEMFKNEPSHPATWDAQSQAGKRWQETWGSA